MSPERHIENLIYRYAELIDDGDFGGVAGLLGRAALQGPDGVEQARGAEAIAAMYRGFTRLYDDGTPATHHVTTNVLIEVVGDSATARSYFTVLQAVAGMPLQPIIAGCYRDSFARDGEGWYFTGRQMLPRLLGDLSAHLLQDIR